MISNSIIQLQMQIWLSVIVLIAGMSIIIGLFCLTGYLRYRLSMSETQSIKFQQETRQQNSEINYMSINLKKTSRLNSLDEQDQTFRPLVQQIAAQQSEEIIKTEFQIITYLAYIKNYQVIILQSKDLKLCRVKEGNQVQFSVKKNVQESVYMLQEAEVKEVLKKIGHCKGYYKLNDCCFSRGHSQNQQFQLQDCQLKQQILLKTQDQINQIINNHF